MDDAPHAPSRSRLATRAVAARVWEIESWKDADKVLLVSLLTLPFGVGWLLRTLAVRGDPTLSPYLSRGFISTMVPFLVAQAVGHLALIVAALVVRRRAAARATWLVHLEIQFWLACMSFSLYVVGPFTSSFGVLVLALPVAGYQIFDARPMHYGLATLVTGAAVGTALSLLGVIPYAPFIAEAPYANGRLNPAWVVSFGVPSIFATGVVLFIHISLMRRLRVRQAELERTSRTDALTGLANRAVFFDRLEAEIARARRYGLALCVAMIDVDHFKRINDTHGHLAGDEVLRNLSATLAGAVRVHDLAARYGGEEFAIVLPHTSLRDAPAVTTRLLEATRRLSVTAAGQMLSVSIGVAELALGEDADGVVARADAALYQSKRDGRDRVTFAATPNAPAVAS